MNPDIKDRIIAAANALAAEGIENPTNDQVRERLGKGSLAHISPVMRQWRESRKAGASAVLEMPDDLKRVVEASLGQIWATASKLAQTSVQAYRQEADEAINSATQERDEALLEIQRLEARMAEMEKTLADKDQTINKSVADLEAARAHGAKASAENAALAARIEDRDRQLSELKELLAETRKDNKALQAELIELARNTKDKE